MTFYVFARIRIIWTHKFDRLDSSERTLSSEHALVLCNFHKSRGLKITHSGPFRNWF